MGETQHSYRVVNPYNFIPFENEPERKTLSERYPDPTKLLSGWMDVDIWLKTPLIIPASVPICKETVRKQNTGKKAYHYTYDFYRLDGKPVIPGSSLRGMLRSLYEAASNSCLPFLPAEPNRPISQRTPLYAAFHRRGLLEFNKEQNTWSIWSARTVCNKILGSDVSNAVYVQNGKKYHNAQRVAFKRITDHSGMESFRIVPEESNEGTVEYGYLQFSIPVVQTKEYYVRILTKNGNTPIYTWEPGDDSAWRSLHGSVYDTCRNTVFRKYRQAPSTQEALYKAMETVKSSGGMIPVFFSEVERDGQKLFYFSGAAAGRVQQRKTWPEIMGRYKPCDGTLLCPACALFGTAEGDGLKGRLRFSDAHPLRPLKPEEHTLQILSSPKPSAFEFYLRRPESANDREVTYWNFDYFGFRTEKLIKAPNQDGTVSEKTVEGTEYEDLPNATPRGRKMYWHSNIQPDSRKKSDLNATMSAVFPEESTATQPDFRSRIYFDRVTEEQLRDLLWVVTLGENIPNSTRWQKLGHAKPLGYGSVKLTVADCQIRVLDSNLEMRMEPWTVPAAPDCSFSMESRSMKALLRMCDANTVKNLRVEYPLGVKGENQNPFIYQWFSNNRTNAKDLVTLPEPTDTDLTLESYTQSKRKRRN